MSESDIIYCARHPKEETAISCASCGTPICPKCMVVTPVGMKCRDCGTSKGTSLYKIHPARFLLAGLVALIAGIPAALISSVGFLAIFIGMAYGYFAGSMILKASGMKRGLKMELLAGIGMVVGALVFRLVPWLIATKGQFTPMMLACPYFWLGVVIATSCAVSKIRYM